VSSGGITKGALYIVTQRQVYLDLLRVSAGSLNRAMPDLPITVFSQFPIESPLFERVILVQASEDGFYDKTRFLGESPYERTLFLDADTFVIEPVPELFTLLDHFDIAATHEEYIDTDWFGDYPRTDIPTSFPEFNTGVLIFKRSAVMQNFLQEWCALYDAYHHEKPERPLNDQPFFRAAMYSSALRMATLTREYNCKFRGQGYLNGRVKILHGHHQFKLDEKHVERVIRALNASTRPRVYIAGSVYEQKIVGRLEGQRTAHRVGTFPEPPESMTHLRLKRLQTMWREQGTKKILSKGMRVALRGNKRND